MTTESAPRILVVENNPGVLRHIRESLSADLMHGDPKHAGMIEILKSANHAADLARQLGGCSRRQASSRQVVGLHRTSGDC